MATYVIGDVQGCFSELQALLKQIDFQPTTDKLWLAGDVVNRGPQSLEVVRYLMSLGTSAKVVIGNHEMQLMAVATGAAKYGRRDTFKSILEAPDRDELLDWVFKQPFAIYDKSFHVLMVHAGIVWDWSIEDTLNFSQELQTLFQSPTRGKALLEAMYQFRAQQLSDTNTPLERMLFTSKVLTGMCYCYKDGRLAIQHTEPLGEQPAYCIPWFEHPDRKTKDVDIVFGHWCELDGESGHDNVFALDTGCVIGKRLTALRLEDKKMFSVASQKNYMTELPVNLKWFR